MKSVFAFLFFLTTASHAHAVLMKCDVVAINGSVPQKPSSVVIDSEKVLLDLNRGNGHETLLGKDSIYIADANAIWFDRASECKYKRTSSSAHAIRHAFKCGGDIVADISLNLDGSIGGGRFESVLSVPNMPSEKFSFSFLRCEKI